MGNIWSVKNALNYIGCLPEVTSSTEKILKASYIILPGVGSFRKAMRNINELKIDKALKTVVKMGEAKILGICLGMQLLGYSSQEDGKTSGLGFIPNQVEKFKNRNEDNLKIPHIGFNTVKIQDNSGLFFDLDKNSDFYFVHSYRMLPEQLSKSIATCKYIDNFLAAFQQSNIMGTQFHPEKSQTNGLKMLQNFINLT